MYQHEHGGEVKIWQFNLDVSLKLEKELTVLLTASERERASKFRFEKHRRRFVVGRGMLRTVLAHYLACEAVDIIFSYNDYGKPSVRMMGEKAEGVTFSVSNSSSLGAVAISRNLEMGFDLERIRPNKDHGLIVENSFSAEERSWFEMLPEQERTGAFFDLWTCKEAYLKGKGSGLSVPLSSFYISIQEDSAKLIRSELDETDPLRWVFYRYEPAPGFTACLASTKPDYSVSQDFFQL